MSDKTQLEVDTKQSVAFDIAMRIENTESKETKPEDYRKYFLDLYVECLNAASHQRKYD